jgi:hypothetical protein
VRGFASFEKLPFEQLPPDFYEGEIDRGEYVDGFEVIAQLRAKREAAGR